MKGGSKPSSNMEAASHFDIRYFLFVILRFSFLRVIPVPNAFDQDF
jgi:hypothetical protein